MKSQVQECKIMLGKKAVMRNTNDLEICVQQISLYDRVTFDL